MLAPRSSPALLSSAVLGAALLSSWEEPEALPQLLLGAGQQWASPALLPRVRLAAWGEPPTVGEGTVEENRQKEG